MGIVSVCTVMTYGARASCESDRNRFAMSLASCGNVSSPFDQPESI